MKTTTLTAMRAIYESDPARTRADRELLLKTLGLTDCQEAARPAEKLVAFEEAAKRLNRTTRTVHLLVCVNRKGIVIVHKVHKTQLIGSRTLRGRSGVW